MPTGDRKLDEFESIFRSAIKEVFHFSPPEVERVVLVTDLPDTESGPLRDTVAHFLRRIDSAEWLTWTVLGREAWIEGQARPIPTLLELLDAQEPHLIVTYRHLLGAVRDLPHTLGSVVDSLTQRATAPVLLLPPPDAANLDEMLEDTKHVMVVTDHVTGDDRLVNWGVHLTHRKGTLYLAHAEPEAALRHYLDVIGKLRRLDSDYANEEIPRKLVEIPTAYLQSISSVLAAHSIEETVVPIVKIGNPLSVYRQLVATHEANLLIVNSRDESQLAMSGIAHALAVEIRNRPLLLL